MSKRNRLRLVLLLAPAWALFHPPPAAARIAFGYEQTRVFEGRPGYVTLYGSIPGSRVIDVDPRVTIERLPEGGERIELTLVTAGDPGAVHLFAHRLELPALTGSSELVVQGVDFVTGVFTEHFHAVLAVEPPLQFDISRTTLAEGESFTLRTRYTGYEGGYGTWTRVGNHIRIPVDIGCFYCAIPYPIGEQDLLSEPIGPLPGGVYTVEIVDASGYLDHPFQRETIEVVPREAKLQDGRFAVELRLDPPHGTLARPVFVPSRDSALFYFFSPANWEAMVKVLDGCALNGRYWVFAAASTDVGYTLAVRDEIGGGIREYRHEAGHPAPAITDIEAFACAGAP